MKNIIKNMNVDWKVFRKISICNLSFFILFILIFNVFSFISKGVSSRLAANLGVSDLSKITAETLKASQPNIGGFVFILLAMTILVMIVQLYNYSFFENKIWNIIFNKRTTFKNTSKFILLNISLTLIFSAIMLVIFALISRFQGGLIKIGVTIFYLALLFCIYLIFIGYWAFGRTHLVIKSIKEVYNVGVKRIELTVIPLIASVIVFIAINLILKVFSLLSEGVLLVLSTIMLVAYLAWFRLYMTNALKSVKL